MVAHDNPTLLDYGEKEKNNTNNNKETLLRNRSKDYLSCDGLIP